MGDFQFTSEKLEWDAIYVLMYINFQIESDEF